MAYTPKNLAVFTAAFAGAMAGMGTSDRVITDTVSADYAGLAQVAGAFAQALDTAWGTNSYTELDVQTIEECCETSFQSRAPQATPDINGTPSPFLTPATFTPLATAIVAMVRQGDVYFAAQGIVPQPAVPAQLNLWVKNIVTTNIADLSAYPVAPVLGTNDKTTNAEGDLVVLLAQTVPEENGIYRVGAVAAGLAPLTRASCLPTGYAFGVNSMHLYVSGGTFYAGSLWNNIAAGVVGTNDPSFKYEECRGRDILVRRARNVVNGNVPDLSAFVVAADPTLNDNVLCTADSQVLLIAQTDPTENGLYNVGAVNAGLAPLTRVPEMADGTVLFGAQGAVFEIVVGLGDLFARTTWFSTAAAGTIIGTGDPLFFPECVSQNVTLVAGAATITNVPIVSATRVNACLTRMTPNTCAATDGGYVLNGAPTAGKLGTASMPIMASVLAGTINNADISTLKVTIFNR